MKIGIVLCTYNRCGVLPNALESIAASELPAGIEWEILIIDNNSSDRTHEVSEEFCRRMPSRFRYIFEGRPGKSFALNTGIAASDADVLVFVDDDVVVERTWLDRLTAPLFESDRWAGVGGPVVVQWPTQAPRWLPRGPYALGPLAGFMLGGKAEEVFSPLIGANMAYRASMFRNLGGFRTDLGPSPNKNIPRVSEDSEFGRRVLAAGERLFYEPAAIVHHPAYQERLKKEYFQRWWYAKGVGNIRSEEVRVGPGTIVFLKVPLHIYRRLAVWTLRWLTAIEPSYRFECKLKVWCMLGTAAELRRRDSQDKAKRDVKMAEVRD